MGKIDTDERREFLLMLSKGEIDSSTLTREERREFIKIQAQILIDLYNDGLLPSMTLKNKAKNVEGTFICSYNYGCTGLFTKKETKEEMKSIISKKEVTTNYFYGIDTDIIGIVQYDKNKEKWLKTGESVQGKIATCDMTNAISFEGIRAKMLYEGIIDTYVLGMATDDEIVQALNYAADYFNDIKYAKKM